MKPTMDRQEESSAGELFNPARMVPMKILVYGAGVIGTLYAARLQQAGHQVTVLARTLRLADIRRHGLVLEDVVTGLRSVTYVSMRSGFMPKTATI
jgi:pyruvate/2-oxoglutarate dehydrogenase complex dihydrolipoamide dehydrogenase (E3) component